MKKYIYLYVIFFVLLGILFVGYKKLNKEVIKDSSIFYEAQQQAKSNGQSFILIDAPDWCKDCVALADLYRANYGNTIGATISSLSGVRIILKSNNCDDNTSDVNQLLSKCNIKNVPSLIIFNGDTFTVKTDITEIAGALYSATQE